jgi:hypothetical protein
VRGHIARLLHDLYVYLYICARSISEESIALRGSGSLLRVVYELRDAEGRRTRPPLRRLVREMKCGNNAFHDAEILKMGNW